MENQINVGNQNTQQIGQNPINQPAVTPVPEKPKFNFWMISTVILAIFLLAILGWYFFISPQSSTNRTDIPINSTGVVKNQTANNDFTVTRVIVNLTKFESPSKNQDALKYGYSESVLGKYEADIGILLSSSYLCPKDVVTVKEYEGSILGSFGINKAVTYFLPQLETSKCTKGTTESQYKLLVKWNKRSDTDWTIVIPGYSGAENTHSQFIMFTEEINKNGQPDQAKADELKEYVQNLITTSYSLTNNPKIVSSPDFSFDRNSNRLKLVMNFEFGNSCSANVDMELETQTWISTNNTFYIWANPEPKPKSGSGGCPEIYSPTKKQVEFFIPVPVEVVNATVLVPNYPMGSELPIYIKNIGL